MPEENDTARRASQRGARQASTTPLRAAVLVTVGALLISLSPVFVRAADVAPTAAGVYRMLFGGLTLGLILLVRPEMRAGWRANLGGSVLIAAFFTADIWFWHQSIHLIGPGLSSLLCNFQVFILTFVGVIWLRERIGWRFVTGLVCSTVGLWLLFGREWSGFTPEYRLGVAFGLLTAVAYAFYLLSLRGFQMRHHGIRSEARLLQVTVFCGLMLAVVNLVEGDSWAIPDSRSLLSLIALGAVCQVGGWICITRGMPFIGASLVGLLLLLQPSGSMVWDGLFFGLRLSGWEIAGVMLALVGIYFGVRSSVRRPPGSSPASERS